MLFWIFLVRCSSRSIVIFLIVSKEIQKYDQRKFYLFYIYIISQTSNTKEIRENILKKIFAEIFLWKEKIFTKIKFVEKNFRKKNVSKKEIRKKF